MFRAGTRKAALLLGLAVSGVLTTTTAGHAAVEDPDIDTFATYEYRVDPAAGRVAVAITLTVTADKPNRASNGGSYQYYFQGYYFPIPTEAENVTVTDAQGTALTYAVNDRNEFAQFLEIDFRRNIFYRQTATVVVSFTLPEGVPRSEAPTRVNEAYAGFGTWTAPNLEGATVRVIAPRGFEDRGTGSQVFAAQPTADEEWFVAEDVDPETFWAGVSLARDTALASSDLEVDGHEVTVRAWPDDTMWADFVSDKLETGLPILIDQVGLAWPITEELTVVESYSPYLNGYAGWYDKSSHIIEIGDELDAHLIFHEVSHVWFNDDLFDQRWITEGLADEFAASVVERTGEERPDPTSTSLLDGAAGPLNRWTISSADEEEELWSYGASWTVTRGIVEEIGIDTLADVVNAASSNEISYVGDQPAETGPEQADWRLYLDLIENRGDVTDSAITDLFEEWVLTDREADTLEDRATSRQLYHDLEEVGGEWAPPLAVRTAMADWKFVDADQRIALAEALLGERNELLELLEPMQVTLPSTLEEAYESSAEDFTEMNVLMTNTSAAAEDLRQTHDHLVESTGLLQRVGAIGTDHAARLDQAAASFREGDLIGASDQAAAVDSDLDGMARVGAIRVGIACGVVLMIMLGLLLKRRRHTGDPTIVESTSDAPALETVDEPTPASAA